MLSRSGFYEKNIDIRPALSPTPVTMVGKYLSSRIRERSNGKELTEADG